jgi:hypothetical protein
MSNKAFNGWLSVTSCCVIKNKIKFRIIYCFAGEVSLGKRSPNKQMDDFVRIYPPQNITGF